MKRNHRAGWWLAIGSGILISGLAAFWILHRVDPHRIHPLPVPGEGAKLVPVDGQTRKTPGGFQPPEKPTQPASMTGVIHGTVSRMSADGATEFAEGVRVHVALAERIFGIQTRAGFSGEGSLAIRDRRREAIRSSPTTLTGAGGEFRVEDLPSGSYLVVVEDGGRLGAVSREVFLLPGETKRVDLVLPLPLAISGRVVDTEGKPMPGLLVVCEPAVIAAAGRKTRERILAAWMAGGGLRDVRAETRSGEPDGAFRLSGLEPVPYSVWAASPDLVSSIHVDVDPGTDDLELVVSKGRTIRGRVSGDLGKPVLDFEAAAVPSEQDADAVLRLLKSDTGAPPGNEIGAARQTVTGTNAFEIRGLLDDHYDVLIDAEGYAPHVASGIDLRTRDQVDLGKIQLIRDRGISGRVIGPDGGVVRGVTVEAYIAGNERDVFNIQRRPVAAAMSGEDGRYLLARLPAWRFDLYAMSPIHATARRQGVAVNSPDVDFVLEAGAALDGIVKDESTGEPIAGAKVTCLPGKVAFTGEDGRFELRGVSPPAGWHGAPGVFQAGIRAEASGYIRGGKLLALDPGGGNSAEIALKPSPIFHGVVKRKEDGSPAGGARVTVATPGMAVRLWLGEEPPVAYSGESGEFRLQLAQLKIEGAPVTPVLIATHEEFGAAISPPIDGGGMRCELLLTKGAAIRGRLRNGDGDPVTRATVSLRHATAPTHLALESEFLGFRDYVSAAVSNSSGEYSLEGILPGQYVIDADHPSYARQSVEVAVEETQALIRKDIELDEGVTITGLVGDASGNPIPGAEVLALCVDPNSSVMRFMPALENLLSESGGVRRTISGDGGRYSLSRVPSCATLVVARAQGFETGHSALLLERSGRAEIDIFLQELAMLEGQVRESGTGAPVTEFVLELRALNEPGRGPPPGVMLPGYGNPTPQRRQSVWDPEGRFVLRRVPEGLYSLRVLAKGYLAAEKRVPVAPDGPARVEVLLERGAVLSGRVVDSSGTIGIAGAMASLCRSGPGGSLAPAAETARTGTDGRFAIEGIEKGKFVLLVTHDDFIEWRSEPIAVSEDIDYGEVRLQEGLRVSVAVDGLPEADRGTPPSVSIAPAGGGGRELSLYPKDGMFLGRSVPPGDYFILIKVEGYHPYRFGPVGFDARRPGARIPYVGRRKD